MRRTASILVSILIGGLAAGLGTYVFLRKANLDRERLAAIAVQAQQEAVAAKASSQQTVAEANQKLNEANAEITKAQGVIQTLQDERALIAAATPLTTPAPKSVKGWVDAVDVDLGVSLKLPPSSVIDENSADALTASKDTSLSSLAQGKERWLSITPYDVRLENELTSAFSSSTDISFLVDGHLLVGEFAASPDNTGDIYVFHVQNSGVRSHLIWIHRPASISDQTFTNLLATLRFAK